MTLPFGSTNGSAPGSNCPRFARALSRRPFAVVKNGGAGLAAPTAGRPTSFDR